MNIEGIKQYTYTITLIAIIGLMGMGYAASTRPSLFPEKPAEPIFQTLSPGYLDYVKEEKATAPAITVAASATTAEKEKQSAAQVRRIDTLVSEEDLQHLNLSADNFFDHNEIVAVIRSDGSLKYAQIYAPELLEPGAADENHDGPQAGYLRVSCFIKSGCYMNKQYPIACIFKIDADTKEPAVCPICKRAFGQNGNCFYQCGHMFHKSCLKRFANLYTCPDCGNNRQPYLPPSAANQSKKASVAASAPTSSSATSSSASSASASSPSAGSASTASNPEPGEGPQ
jgi:predicted  nucleic acid-binding Zn-ribbon protein